MVSWYPEETRREYLSLFNEIQEEVERIVEEEHGSDGFENPDLVWEIAQSTPKYNKIEDLDEYLKLSDAVFDGFTHEINWSRCAERIRQYVSPRTQDAMLDHLPTKYAQEASEEVILHAVTYQLTGEGSTR